MREAKEIKNRYGKTSSPWTIVTDVTDENGFFLRTLLQDTVGPFIYPSYSSPSKPARELPADDHSIVPGGY